MFLKLQMRNFRSRLVLHYEFVKSSLNSLDSFSHLRFVSIPIFGYYSLGNKIKIFYYMITFR